jgi:hypothetical protein
VAAIHDDVALLRSAMNRKRMACGAVPPLSRRTFVLHMF